MVRESEAARTERAAGALRNADDAIRGFFDNGVKLDPGARRDIVAAARTIGQIAEDSINEYRGLIQGTVDVIDPDGTLGSADRIFRETGPEAKIAERLRSAVEAVAEKGEVPEDVRSQIRNANITTEAELEALVANNDVYAAAWREHRETAPAAEQKTEDDGTVIEVWGN